MADRWWKRELGRRFASEQEQDAALTSVAAAALLDLFPEVAPTPQEQRERHALPRHHPAHISTESRVGYQQTRIDKLTE